MTALPGPRVEGQGLRLLLLLGGLSWEEHGELPRSQRLSVSPTQVQGDGERHPSLPDLWWVSVLRLQLCSPGPASVPQAPAEGGWPGRGVEWTAAPTVRLESSPVVTDLRFKRQGLPPGTAGWGGTGRVAGGIGHWHGWQPDDLAGQV